MGGWKHNMVQTKDKYGYRNIEYRDSSRERFELHDADYRGYAKARNRQVEAELKLGDKETKRAKKEMRALRQEAQEASMSRYAQRPRDCRAQFHSYRNGSHRPPVFDPPRRSMSRRPSDVPSYHSGRPPTYRSRRDSGPPPAYGQSRAQRAPDYGYGGGYGGGKRDVYSPSPPPMRPSREHHRSHGRNRGSQHPYGDPRIVQIEPGASRPRY